MQTEITLLSQEELDALQKLDKANDGRWRWMVLRYIAVGFALMALYTMGLLIVDARDIIPEQTLLTVLFCGLGPITMFVAGSVIGFFIFTPLRRKRNRALEDLVREPLTRRALEKLLVLEAQIQPYDSYWRFTGYAPAASHAHVHTVRGVHITS